MVRRFEDGLDHLTNRNGRPVSDIDWIADRMLFDREQAAAREIFDVKKIAHFIAASPHLERFDFFHGPAHQRGNNVATARVEIVMNSMISSCITKL